MGRVLLILSSLPPHPSMTFSPDLSGFKTMTLNPGAPWFPPWSELEVILRQIQARKKRFHSLREDMGEEEEEEGARLIEIIEISMKASPTWFRIRKAFVIW